MTLSDTFHTCTSLLQLPSGNNVHVQSEEAGSEQPERVRGGSVQGGSQRDGTLTASVAHVSGPPHVVVL